MKRALFFIATSLYSNAQAVRASIKKWTYAVFAFVASSLMMLVPVSIDSVTTSGETLIKNFSTAEFMLHDFIVELDENGITCKVENKKFTCAGTQLNEGNKVYDRVYEETINNKKYIYKYRFVLLDSPDKYLIDENLFQEQPNDNIIVFGEDEFLVRKLNRNKDGQITGNVYINGSYKRVGSFDFQKVVDKYNYKESSSRAYLHTTFADFLYAVSIADFNVILIVWLLLAILVNLLCVVSGGFVLYYGNKKGNLADVYGIKGSLKIACNLLLLPTILGILVGLFMPESIIITTPIIFSIRLIIIYRAQFTRKGQKLAIKTKKGLEDLI